MRLDFIAVGPQRTASSWLYSMLRQHPQISLPVQVKETMFWDKHYEKGEAWYEAFFAKDDDARRRGEIAPTLFPSEEARQRLCQFPELRVIVLLRDPVARAASHYRHERALGLQRGSLKDAIARDPRILEASRYSHYLPKWCAAFGRKRVFLVPQEMIAKNPIKILADLCRFLEIDTRFIFADTAMRTSTASTTRSPLLARWLYQGASFLRARQWHGLVTAANRVGLRQLLYSKRAEMLSAEDYAFLEDALAEERLFLQELGERGGQFEPGSEGKGS